MRLSFGNGVRATQSLLSKVMRYEPVNSLPPDLVMACTTPPWKRPNSAETAAVVIVVSWSASSMKSTLAWPRMFSFTTTPLTT